DHIFVKATPPSKNYTLSLHDALPILSATGKLPLTWAATDKNSGVKGLHYWFLDSPEEKNLGESSFISVSNPYSEESYRDDTEMKDRKSTRLNSSHVKISYAVFCLKKK